MDQLADEIGKVFDRSIVTRHTGISAPETQPQLPIAFNEALIALGDAVADLDDLTASLVGPLPPEKMGEAKANPPACLVHELKAKIATVTSHAKVIRKLTGHIRERL